MNDTAEVHEFANREAFRNWLIRNHNQKKGIWITFIKGNKEFSAGDALEESICFGWIDGLMKSVDEKTYKKYFSRRKDTKKWSDKNTSLFNKLFKTKLMTEAGVEAYNAERKNGGNAADINGKIEILREVLKEKGEVAELFEKKPPSRKKQFAGFYCEAKTDETRKKRKEKIIQALMKNYNGMLY